MRVRYLALAVASAALVTVAASTAIAAQAPATCNGSKALCSRPFDTVVLAGSHNSMSAQSLGWLIPNQKIDMPAQLTYGIRALLFDTHYGRKQANGSVVTDDKGTVTTGTRGLYLCHDVCQIGAMPLVQGLKGIATWVKKNPNNVLLFDVEDYITPKDFVGAMKDAGLTKYVYRGKTGTTWPTLGQMISSKQQIVVLAEDHAGVAPWYHQAYDGILQETPYSWATPDLLTSPANWAASCRPNRGGTKAPLFLMNHWSPSIPPPTPDLAASAAVNAKSVIVGRARACQQVRGKLPTVIAVDQATAGGLIAAVRELNK